MISNNFCKVKGLHTRHWRHFRRHVWRLEKFFWFSMDAPQKWERGIEMEIPYQEIADKAVAYAKNIGIHLDYTKESIEQVDIILDNCYTRLSEYEGEDGDKALWNVAVYFGIYLGETLLRIQMGEQGYKWYVSDGLPILKKNNNEMSPITKAHKRILYGPGDSVKSFCDVALMIADGGFPSQNVLRAVDVELASGHTEENVLYQDIDSYILLVEEGKEDFVILQSHDSLLQFYGVNNQFVAEVRVDLPKKKDQTFSIIDIEKEQLTQRSTLTTPYGSYTPQQREIISLEQIREAVKAYYNQVDIEQFLKIIPCVETTDETK